jgi:hypothetical protein
VKVFLYELKTKSIKKLVVLKLLKNNILHNKKIVKILKFLKICLKYYLNNKKILLLGTSKKITYFFNFITQFKNIAYIPQNLWLNGLLTNSFVFKALYFSKKKESFKLLLNFLPNYDLIVGLTDYKNKELLKSITQPVIYFKDIFKPYLINNTKLAINHFVYLLIYQVFLKYKHVK